MMKKAILAVVAIALMVLLVMTMGRRDAPPAGDSAPRTGDTGTSIQGTLTADSPDAPSRSGESPAADPGQAQPPAQPIPAPRLIHRSGTVLHADSLPAEGLVYWIWSDVRPAWAELHPGIRELTLTPRLLEPSGITDRRGTWAVATDLAEPRAITFAVDGGLLVSFELTRSELILPEIAGIEAVVHGAEPGDEWTVLLGMDHAPRNDGASWTMVTASGVAVVCDLDREVSLDTSEPFHASVLADESYILSADAEEFELEPEPRSLTAPATVTYTVVRRFAALTLEVVDRPGGPAAEVGGWFDIRWSSPPHRDEGQIHAGRAEFVRDLPPGYYEVSVLVEDGETFEDSFSVEDDWTGQALEFVRGEGSRPLEIRLPGPVAAEVMRVFLELDGTRRKVQALAADRNGILPTRGGFVRQGPDTILISEPPERWTQLWVPTRSGRVAHANWTGAPAEATAWLPDRPLPPVRLEDLHEENGQPRSGRIQYQMRLFHDTGRYGTVAILDSFEFDSTTSEWPIWSKREPIGMEGHFPVWKLMGTEEPATWVRQARWR